MKNSLGRLYTKNEMDAHLRKETKELQYALDLALAEINKLREELRRK